MMQSLVVMNNKTTINSPNGLALEAVNVLYIAQYILTKVKI
jgi:hypothetical protein